MPALTRRYVEQDLRPVYRGRVHYANDAFDGLVLYAQGVEGGNRLRGIFISNERTPKNPHILVAKEGTLLTDPDSLRVTLRLTDGASARWLGTSWAS